MFPFGLFTTLKSQTICPYQSPHDVRSQRLEEELSWCCFLDMDSVSWTLFWSLYFLKILPDTSPAMTFLYFFCLVEAYFLLMLSTRTWWKIKVLCTSLETGILPTKRLVFDLDESESCCSLSYLFLYLSVFLFCFFSFCFRVWISLYNLDSPLLIFFLPAILCL